jgi:hypothetical protein
MRLDPRNVRERLAPTGRISAKSENFSTERRKVMRATFLLL